MPRLRGKEDVRTLHKNWDYCETVIADVNIDPGRLQQWKGARSVASKGSGRRRLHPNNGCSLVVLLCIWRMNTRPYNRNSCAKNRIGAPNGAEHSWLGWVRSNRIFAVVTSVQVSECKSCVKSAVFLVLNGFHACEVQRLLLRWKSVIERS